MKATIVPIGKQNIKTHTGRKAHAFPLFLLAPYFTAAITDMTQRIIGAVLKVRLTLSSGAEYVAMATVNKMDGIAHAVATQNKPFLADRLFLSLRRSM
jgi:hypothetical protein